MNSKSADSQFIRHQLTLLCSHCPQLFILREWCLTFGAMNHSAHSIWLSIQSVIMHHFPNSDAVRNGMSLDMLIDFVWSMTVLDLLPTQWLMPDLVFMMNYDLEHNGGDQLEALSFVHKTRAWEIIQSLYANPMGQSTLRALDPQIVESLQEYYGEYVVPQFHQQCKLRPALLKFCKLLTSKQISYELGGSVGNMHALGDIVIPQHKICLDVFDYPHITRRSQSRTREWVKFKARREITRRLVENTLSDWHFMLVNGMDDDFDVENFSKLLHKFVFAHRFKERLDHAHQEERALSQGFHDTRRLQLT